MTTAATTASTTDGARDAIRRPAGEDVGSLHDRVRQTQVRAEELLARSATVLALSGDLRASVRARPAPVDVSAIRRRLADAQQRIAHLEHALRSNRRIGMALGVLMARHQMTEEQAFDVLRLQSSRRNVKLAALAEEVVYTGGL